MVHGVGVGARRATTSLEIREKKISVDSTRELVRSYFPPFSLNPPSAFHHQHRTSIIASNALQFIPLPFAVASIVGGGTVVRWWQSMARRVIGAPLSLCELIVNNRHEGDSFVIV